MTGALLATVAALLAPAAAPAEAAPARMLVTADEWSLVLSRRKVKAGVVELQLYNRGEDAHDLAARRRDGTGPTRRLGETRPGALGEARWRLRRGRYRLWCTLPGHEDRGMRATLRVGRPVAGARRPADAGRGAIPGAGQPADLRAGS